MPLNIGRLDTKIAIESKVLTTDPVFKDKGVSYSLFKTVWGARTMNPRGERLEAEQPVAVQEYRWLIRYTSGVKEDMRLVVDDEYFYIVGIERRGRNEILNLITEKRDNANG